MSTLKQHGDNYKQALQAQDAEALLREKNWLTTAAASALLEQDAEAMRQVRACFADLGALADRFDSTGKPGDRWRALGDVLTLALQSGKPLEQLRLVLPNSVGGLLMKHIQKEPGITPSALALRTGKQANHISNALKKLDAAGLLHTITRGKSKTLFLSVLGKQALESLAPLQVVEKTVAPAEFKYCDLERLRRIEADGTPKLVFAQSA
jgi:hypothetical protein